MQSALPSYAEKQKYAQTFVQCLNLHKNVRMVYQWNVRNKHSYLEENTTTYSLNLSLLFADVSRA